MAPSPNTCTEFQGPRLYKHVCPPAPLSLHRFGNLRGALLHLHIFKCQRIPLDALPILYSAVRSYLQPFIKSCKNSISLTCSLVYLSIYLSLRSLPHSLFFQSQCVCLHRRIVCFFIKDDRGRPRALPRSLSIFIYQFPGGAFDGIPLIFVGQYLSMLNQAHFRH